MIRTSVIRILSLALSGLAVLTSITLTAMTNHFLNQDHSRFGTKTPAPDFASFTNAKDKKNAFFDYLLPMVQQSNESILNKRARLEEIAQKLSESKLNDSDSRFLNQLTREYSIDSESLISASDEQKIEFLSSRIDRVPESLALAQAAKESGWGTSRFARDANNYFGQWCYKQGCGLVPNRRPKGANHEVKKFDHAVDSVNAYLKNINTHQAYEELRDLRATLRQSNQISGIELANALDSYSQRGNTYTREIQSMIRFNNLDQLDRHVK